MTGSDPQRRAPVNSTYAMTFSACAYALKCLIDPDLPVNDGFYRLVDVEAPPGTVVNGTWPSAVVGGWETHDRLVEVIFRALLPAFPERLPAGTKGMMCQAGFGSLDVEKASYTCFYDTFAGGYGGRATSDGPDAVQAHGQNTENAPVEETELNYPVRIPRLALVENSEGAGRFRGGLGLRKDYLFDRPTTYTILADRDRFGPHGVFGGLDASVAEYVLIRGARGAAARVEGDGRARAGRRDQRAHVRRGRLRAARGARSGGRARGRARGEGQRRAGARRVPRRDRGRRRRRGRDGGAARMSGRRRISCLDRNRCPERNRPEADMAGRDRAVSAARVTHLPPRCDRAYRRKRHVSVTEVRQECVDSSTGRVRRVGPSTRAANRAAAGPLTGEAAR